MTAVLAMQKKLCQNIFHFLISHLLVRDRTASSAGGRLGFVWHINVVLFENCIQETNEK